MKRVALVSVLGAILALASLSIAGAQGPDIQIVQLDCESEPELVVIQNLGDQEQDLLGWTLQSDPPDEEVFDLLGVLQPGDSTSISVGQQAVFRDADPTDYARIVDDQGVVVHEFSCAEEPVPEPSPTPSPEPSPEVSPPSDVPNGGGAPPIDGGTSSAVMVLVGGAMAVAGLATFAAPWLRTAPATASNAPARPRQFQGLRRETLPITYRLAVFTLTASAAFVILRFLRRR